MITFIRRSCLLFWWPGGSHPSPNSSRNQSRPPRAVFDPPRGRTGFPVRGQPDILTDRTLGRPDEPGALNHLRVQTAGLVDESHPDRGSEQPDEHVAVHERAEIATVGLIATEGSAGNIARKAALSCSEGWGVGIPPPCSANGGPVSTLAPRSSRPVLFAACVTTTFALGFGCACVEPPSAAVQQARAD